MGARKDHKASAASPALTDTTDTETTPPNVTINAEAFRYFPAHAIVYGMALAILNRSSAIDEIINVYNNPRLQQRNGPRYSEQLRNELRAALLRVASENKASNGENTHDA